MGSSGCLGRAGHGATDRTAELVALQRRAAEIEAQLATTNERLHEEIDQLRSLYEGGRVLAAEGAAPASASITAQQETVETTRQALARLHGEQRAVARALVTPLPPDPAHAHLRHRELPDQDVLRPKHWTLRLWSTISVSVLLLAVAALVYFDPDRSYLWLVGVVVVVVGVEAATRGRVLPYLATVAVSLLLIAVSWLVVTNFRLGTAIVLVVAALGLLLELRGIPASPMTAAEPRSGRSTPIHHERVRHADRRRPRGCAGGFAVDT
jgi:hypothetical protein